MDLRKCTLGWRIEVNQTDVCLPLYRRRGRLRSRLLLVLLTAALGSQVNSFRKGDLYRAFQQVLGPVSKCTMAGMCCLFPHSDPGLLNVLASKTRSFFQHAFIFLVGRQCMVIVKPHNKMRGWFDQSVLCFFLQRFTVQGNCPVFHQPPVCGSPGITRD